MGIKYILGWIKANPSSNIDLLLFRTFELFFSLLNLVGCFSISMHCFGGACALVTFLVSCLAVIYDKKVDQQLMWNGKPEMNNAGS